MPKRKRAETAVATPTLSNHAVVEEKPDHCFDILDGEIAKELSPESSGLSSPPSSAEEVGGGSLVSEETAIPIPISKKKAGAAPKKAGAAKKAPAVKKGKKKENDDGSDAEFVELAESGANGKPKKAAAAAKKAPAKKKKAIGDEDGMESEVEEPEERPPAVNSDYLPLPWKGRLGFACLNTYLRYSNPPVFCSRTCRIETILKHGKEGQKYVESLGLANASDLEKLIHWNERYGIKFLRISSEMFPFASHPVYGYTLEFAKDVLARAGAAAMKYGHRLSVHPGQFTQFGSPRKEVVANSKRDVDYHCQLLDFLGLTGQTDRDAVMILHMGGTFGDKEATLQRFRDNYKTLSPGVKARMVLENDDMCWSVHDLLPICKELNIPMVLDWHHHNLIRDPSMREGTLDILQLIPEIKETWTRKGITQKQHYSEPREGAVKHRDRRKHSPRVATLPPCDPTMDLMIEAKDKEQAVFELMRKFKLDGWEKIGDIIPHIREDENKPEPKKRAVKVKKAKKSKKAKKLEISEEGENVNVKAETEEQAEEEVEVAEEVLPAVPLIAGEDVGMGGEEGRVYWPVGKPEWLSPAKRVRVKKVEVEAEEVEGMEEEVEVKKVTKRGKKKNAAAEDEKGREEIIEEVETKKTTKRGKKKTAVLKVEEAEVAVVKAENGDGEAIVAPPAKRARGKKAMAVSTTDATVTTTTTTTAVTKPSRKRKTAVAVKAEEQEEQVQEEVTEQVIAEAPPLAASTKRKRKTAAQKKVKEVVVRPLPVPIVAGLIDGDATGAIREEISIGKRRSTRSRKVVGSGYIEMGEDVDGVGAEAEV